MKIGIYALAKNERKHVESWADSCRDADVRVVTDTGSTDGTPEALEAAGVTVARGYVCPWRWDDAHNLSLHHLPADCDVAIRLDLDERLQPGWRAVVERYWAEGVNNLRYRYVWSWRDGKPDLVFYSDRIHARHGYRWTAPTHEGLVCWAGCQKIEYTDELEIHHHRDTGKRHKTDLALLRVAVREAPHDTRMQWYLAREMDYAGMPEAAAAFAQYLRMPGGAATERAYAMRKLWALTGIEQHLHNAAKEAGWEPDSWAALAYLRCRQQRWLDCAGFAQAALEAPGPTSHATDPRAPRRAKDLLAVALWNLGKRPDALRLAKEAAAECPGDATLVADIAAMEKELAA